MRRARFSGAELKALQRLAFDERQDKERQEAKRATWRREDHRKDPEKIKEDAELDRRLAAPERKLSETPEAIKKRKQRAAKKSGRKLSETPEAIKKRRYRERKKLRAEKPALNSGSG